MSRFQRQIFAIVGAAILLGAGILVPLSQSEDRLPLIIGASVLALAVIALVALCFVTNWKKK